MNAPPATMLDARYRVGSVIARGGMSTVYRGTDTRLDRPVAIKVMDPRLAADPAFRTRFEREARSAARIDHPAVVDVHDQGDDVGPDGPVLFLVMELVEGGTLRDVLRMRGVLGVPAALTVMEPVLAGLAEAHRLGLVHRDVKPENVLISHTGEVKVADFGLVVAAAQAGASHAGVIMGTVAYLSPEQVATGAADPRSDVYAAGILLYELLTGAPPYTGDTAISVAYRHVNSDVPPPSLIAGDVPPELDDLVLRATRRHPGARQADAGALLREMRALAVRLEVPRVAVPVPPRPPVDEQDTLPVGPGPATSGPRGTAVHPMPGQARGGTRTMARPDPDHAPAEPGGPSRYQLKRRRSRQVFAAWIAVVVVVTLLVAIGAWWLGTGRWTAMPSLIGQEEAVAGRLLAEADLVGRRTEEPNGAVPRGRVASTDHAPDTRLLRGSTVTMTISLGLPRVPDIAPGTSVAVAEQALRDADLTPVVSDDPVFSDQVPAEAVIRTSPRAGTELPLGASVTLVTSKGAEPSPVRVPFLIGDDFDEAEEKLADLGLEAEERPRFGRLGRDNGTVVDQDPDVGSEVDPGTTIVLGTF